MRKLFLVMLLGLVAQLVVAQENRTQLLLDGQLVANKAQVDAAQLQHICQLQLSHPDWQTKVVPISFQLIVSLNGKLVSGYCRQGGTLPDKVIKALAAVKKGDIVMLADFNIAAAAQKQVGQIMLTVK